VWVVLFNLYLTYYYFFVEESILFYLHLKLSKKKFLKIIKKIYFLIYGIEFFKGRRFLKINVRSFNINHLNLDKFFFYKLYIYANNAKLFYNGKKKLLHLLKFNHSILLEYVFALYPTAIIIWILIPSFYLLYSLDDDSSPYITIKVIGHQWFWSYEFDNFLKDKFISYNFDSLLVQEGDLTFGEKRLLSVDENLIIPTAANIRFLITSSDVYIRDLYPNLGWK